MKNDGRKIRKKKYNFTAVIPLELLYIYLYTGKDFFCRLLSNTIQQLIAALFPNALILLLPHITVWSLFQLAHKILKYISSDTIYCIVLYIKRAAKKMREILYFVQWKKNDPK